MKKIAIVPANFRAEGSDVIIARSQDGAALMVVVGAISVAMLVGVLALEKRLISAKSTRTGTAHIESAAYLNSIQQLLSNQQFCTDNLQANMGQQSINYDPVNGVGLNQTQLTFNSLKSTSDSTNVTVAGQTSGSQLAMSNLVTSQKPYIDFTKNFQYFGTQATGPNGVLNNQCYGATLHADVNLESQQTGPRRSIGSQTVGADYPIVITTDPTNNNKLSNCFLGVASSFCKPPAPPVITTWTPDMSCHDGWQTTAFTIGFAVQNTVKSVMTCTGSTTPPVITDVTGLTSYSGHTPQNFIGCTLTVYDQIGDTATQSSSLNFNPKECDIAKIQLPSVPACVNAGQPFSVSWTDTANDTNDVITLTFGTMPVQTQMATLSSSSGVMNFAAPTTPSASILISATDNDIQGDSGIQTASVQIKSVPTVTSFSADQPSYDTDHIPSAVTLNWTTPGADSVDISSGVGTGLPANSARTIGAPTTTTTYTLTAHGGCPGTPDAVTTTSVNVTPCTCNPDPTTVPMGQVYNDSCSMPKCTGQMSVSGHCGLANATSPSTAPSSSTDLCSAGNASAVSSGGAPWTWTCGGLGTGTTASCSTTVPYTVAVDLSTGGDAGCVIVLGGAVQCWGENAEGEVGDGTMTQRTVPTQVVGITSGATALPRHMGVYASCALVSGGMKCWGEYIDPGTGGYNYSANSTVPMWAPGLGAGSGVIKVAMSGTGNFCALLSGGVLKCWGQNNIGGPLGNGSFTDQANPVTIFGGGVTDMDVSEYKICAVISGGVQCAGINDNGEIGVPPSSCPNHDGDSSCNTFRQTIPAGSGVSEVSVGWYSSCALFGDSTVKCWGINSDGELGLGYVSAYNSTPTTIPGFSGVTHIFSNFYDNCAQKSDGTAWCWGSDENGALGAPVTNGSSITSPPGFASTGSYYVDPMYGQGPCSGQCDGTASMTNGSIGGSCYNSNSSWTVSGSSCGSLPITCNSTDGVYYNCGYTSCTQTTVNGFSWSPVQVTGIPGTITRIAVDQWMGCALSNSGHVYCWGAQDYGGLANGVSNGDCPAPQPAKATNF